MPTPISNYVISGKVYDVYENILEGAAISVTHAAITPILSTASNPSGEYLINLSGLSQQWARGDSIEIKVVKTAQGRLIRNATIQNSGGGQTENLTLEQTSDIDFEPKDDDLERKGLILAIPALFDGTKVSVTNRLPVDTDETLRKYYLSDDDASGSIQYIGYIDRLGNWYIQQYNTSAGTYRYAKGSSDYPTNWTNRISLTYNYFHNVF